MLKTPIAFSAGLVGSDVTYEHVTRSKNIHQIDWDNVKVLEKEYRNFPRKFLEAIHIRKNGHNLNREETKD